jgi:tetratricopeptide (TPR) repeat protein
MYHKAKNIEKAVEILEKALDMKPDDYLCKEYLGDLRMAQYDAALKKMEAAYRKQPDEAIKAKYVQLKEERTEFIISEFKARAEAHPTELKHRYDLGKALFDANRIDEAIAELQQAKGDARCKTDAGYYLGRCFYTKKNLRLAVKELEAAREGLFDMEGLNKDITYLIGRIYEAAKKPEKALEEYEKIAEADYNYRDVTARIDSLSQF